MDFESLLEPYSDGGTRTVQGQLEWLTTRKGIDINLAQLAVAKVYFEISGGLKFEDGEDQPAGHHLDQYLLKTALEIKKDTWEAAVKVAGDKLEAMISSAIAEGLRKPETPAVTEVKKTPWWKYSGIR